METKHKNLFLCLYFIFFCSFISFGQNADTLHILNNEILIIASYNSDTKYNYENIRDFTRYYNEMGGDYGIAVENMNEFQLRDPEEWTLTVEELIAKYNNLKLLILLGGEAWNGYLNTTNNDIKQIPAICATAARYGFTSPQKGENLTTYTPQSFDFLEVMKGTNVKACFSYDYDIKGNIELAQDFFPNLKHIAFLSDNSYSGITQQAQLRQCMKQFPELEATYIDGRHLTLDGALNAIDNLPPDCALLLGIWRIDSQNMYFVDNASYAFKNTNPSLPVFSITSTALGYWAIGGLTPHYDNIAKDIARKAYQILHTEDIVEQELSSLPFIYQFDHRKLKEFQLIDKKLPEGSIVINKKPSFWDTYKKQLGIIIFVFCMLAISLIIALFFFFKTRALKNNRQQYAYQLQKDKIILKESERQLRIAKENAEKASLLKSKFVSNISHEVRTPLNAIVGFSSLLVSEIDTTDEQREYAQIIQSNSDLLLQLINDVLDLSRLESDKLQFTYESCDIVPFCNNIISLTNLQKTHEVQISLTCTYDRFHLYTDPLKLQQVITNLLNNALKFTPDGGNITLSFKKNDEKDHLIFSVTDTGVGIPFDKQKQVFERFEKLNEFVQGTGLGLPICKQIIEQIGGEIWVDAEYKEGARFVFSHPINFGN